MKRVIPRLSLALQAARELGAARVYWYARYQLELISGHYRRVLPAGKYKPFSGPIHSPFTLPSARQMREVLREGDAELVEEADEVVAGKVRLFGGPPVRLELVPPDAQRHWTFYEGHPATWGVVDIKFLWEPARFGWVYPLGRAYALTGDETYAAAFWEHLQTFLDANPPNQGPNWASAQEAALRMLAFLFAARAFATSAHSTPGRKALLAGVIAAHAQRIPATLSYARAQNNNHRVSEALGLYAVGCALPDHPESARWRDLGWRELIAALQDQIRGDGAYTQHSTNYHRLMLHAALQARLFGQPFPGTTLDKLAAATRWLLAQMDPLSGRAPNLGSNDGANILPLSASDFNDFRPVAQAAARAFLGQPAFPDGAWDEACLWLNLPLDPKLGDDALPSSPGVHRIDSGESWASLRAVQFHERPSHADQLHVEIWWRGENVAMDAGTYRYTAPSPWDNALAQTIVHNTVEVNGQNQMQRGGRFLWLNWAQARLLVDPEPGGWQVAAEHDGYRQLGVIHRRTMQYSGENKWQVIDAFRHSRAIRLGAPANPVYPYRLHWLLPDWPWTLEETTLSLQNSRGGWIKLSIEPEMPAPPLARIEAVSLVRAGEPLAGPKEVLPILGWYSPTYSVKVPALSFSVTLRSPLPLSMRSTWQLIT